jgi:uncharacterized protein YaiL (DUF2058 family)
MERNPARKDTPMAKANPLQEQLLKAGLVKKSKVAEVAREQEKARLGKVPSANDGIARDAERARAEKVERDRALAAERKAQVHATELRAQARQIIADKKVPGAGQIEYRFTTDGAIRTILVDELQRRQLASGVLVIAAQGERCVLLPRAAGDKVRERDAALILLDHGSGAEAAQPGATAEDDAYYAQFQVPDDLVW